MSIFGSREGLDPTLRPQSVHRLAPQDAQALARLLQNYGEAATEQLLAPAAQTSPAEARQRQGDLRAYRLLQAQFSANCGGGRLACVGQLPLLLCVTIRQTCKGKLDKPFSR
ncbi:MAG: hypothetical protein LRZ84_17050 [Desertifilum sp.]|nr:hypothetical protein [Desertifilum sp.]